MKIGKVCVIGMGIMGSEIGVVCANSNYPTVIVEVDEKHKERGLKNGN